MKLYTLTSVYNINNILATGSISPAAYYGRRKFGDSHYEDSVLGEPPEMLVLFSEMPNLDNASFQDVCALEVDAFLLEAAAVKCVGCKGPDGVEVYATERTVYLLPDKVRFIFASNDAATEALGRIERSIETKFADAYRDGFLGKSDAHVKTFSLDPNGIEWDIGIPQGSCDANRDDVIDRTRGFLVGYLLGARLSADDADKDSYLREWRLINDLHDALTVQANEASGKRVGLINGKCVEWRKLADARLRRNPPKWVRGYVEERRCSDLELYSEKQPWPLPLERLLNLTDQEFRNAKLTDAMRTDLRWIKDPTSDECYREVKFALLDSIQNYEPKLYAQYLEKACPPFSGRETYEINEYIDKLLDDVKEGYSAGSCSVISGVKLGKPCEALVVESPSVEEAWSDVFAYILQSSEASDIAFGREAMTTKNGTDLVGIPAFVAKCVEFLEEKCASENEWKTSPERIYLRDLYMNLIDRKPDFRVDSAPDPLSRSLAAFCKFFRRSGNRKDLDKLPDQLLRLGITDMRWAFAFWGAVMGFAVMPKTATNELFSSKEETSKVLAYVDQQLENVGLLDDKRLSEKGLEVLSPAGSVLLPARLGHLPGEEIADGKLASKSEEADDFESEPWYGDIERALKGKDGCWGMPDSWKGSPEMKRICDDVSNALYQSSSPKGFLDALTNIEGKNGRPLSKNTGIYQHCKSVLRDDDLFSINGALFQNDRLFR